jgi:hypothetical protein
MLLTPRIGVIPLSPQKLFLCIIVPKSHSDEAKIRYYAEENLGHSLDRCCKKNLSEVCKLILLGVLNLCPEILS